MSEDKQVCRLSLESPYVDLAVEVFSMLADATRVRIILALRDTELAVGELAAAVGKSPTVASQHLAKLRLARMVATRQDGTRVYYRLVDEHARDLVSSAIFQAQHAVDEHPAHHHGHRAV
jgi:DNA-binding transcriptional ArsR family regulator